MILVGSSVWIDYFRGTTTPQVEKLDSLLGSEPIATGDLILTELSGRRLQFRQHHSNQLNLFAF